MTTTTEGHAFLAGFGDLRRRLTDDGPAWLGELRAAALARFEETGLPGPSLEAWRGTSVAPIAGTVFSPPADTVWPTGGLPDTVRPFVDGQRAVLVDGRFDAGLSRLDELPRGVRVRGLAEALTAGDERVRERLEAWSPADAGPFEALGTALLRDGVVVEFEDGVESATPLTLVHLTRTAERPVLVAPRTLLFGGPRCRGSVVELYASIGDGDSMSLPVTGVHVAAGARIDHVRIQLEAAGAFHVSSTVGRLERDAHYEAHSIDLGGRLVRNELRTVLAGEGGHCNLWGLTLTGGSQHVDNHTTLEHASPHCDSRELYKSILDDRSRTVFTGRIIVRPGAQLTDAKQSNPNLLLSRDALAHTRPQLEIYADDVKCTHGATIGRLDEESTFYLRSRGIPAAEARDMLVHAFAGEVLDRVVDERVRGALARTVDRRLSEGGERS